MSADLKHLLQHPDLEDRFDEQTLQSITAVLDTLSQYGDVSIASERQPVTAHRDAFSAWTVSTQLRDSLRPALTARADDLHAAALYCLVDVVSDVKRQARLAVDKFRDL